MGDPITSFQDNAIQKATEDTTVAFTGNIRAEWRRREQSLKARLETIKREREAAEAEYQSMEDISKQHFDCLVSTFTIDRVRPVWEAQGELMPCSIRVLMGELRGPVQSLPSPSLSSVGNGARRLSSGPAASEDTMEREIVLSVRDSETSTGGSPSTKRPSAKDNDESPDPTVNKRPRISNSDYIFRPSEEPAIQRFRGTVTMEEIDGYHWAFRSPETGPGFYVLICSERDTDLDIHRFRSDPWQFNRAITHYSERKVCHKEFFDRGIGEVSKSMIMQRYGYLVEGMTEDSFRNSNQHVEDELTAEKKNGRVSKKAKRKRYADPPPVHTIHRSPPGGPAPAADMGTDMGAYVNAQAAPSSAGNYIANVRSDL